MKLTDFDIYKNLLHEKSGLLLTPDKTYLVESRLNPVAKKWGYENVEALTIALRGVPDKAMIKDIVEAMTTNETSFFRDQNPFERLKETVLPYMLQNRIHKRKLKIWSAACSSGQEPYTIAMMLKEREQQYGGWKIDILATDIADSILDQAKAGIYSQFEVQRGLPVQLLVKYFTQKDDDKKWLLADTIKNMVQFQAFNLLDSMASLGDFDIIFCRNVLIYFDEKTKSDILNRLSAQLSDDGFLFLGGAETVLGLTDNFKPMPGQRGLYVKANSPHLEKAA